jgi:hypothetical protein
LERIFWEEWNRIVHNSELEQQERLLHLDTKVPIEI